MRYVYGIASPLDFGLAHREGDSVSRGATYLENSMRPQLHTLVIYMAGTIILYLIVRYIPDFIVILSIRQNLISYAYHVLNLPFCEV